MEGLIQLLGFELAMRLVYLHGGSKLYVPVNEGCLLAQQIGVEAFRLLSAEYGGCHVWIPQGQAHVIQARNRQIVARAGSCTVRELASRFELSPRRIQQILKEAR